MTHTSRAYSFSRADLLAMGMRPVTRNFVRSALQFGLALSGVILVFSSMLEGRFAPLPSLIVFAMVAGLYGFIWIVLRIIYAQSLAFPDNAIFTTPRVFAFDEDRLEERIEGGVVTSLPWTGLVRTSRERDATRLFVSRDHAFTVPDNVFDPEGTAAFERKLVPPNP